MRYNRASSQDTLRVARLQASKSQATCYVYATGCGLTIDKRPAPFGQQYIRVEPDAAYQVPSALAQQLDGATEQRIG